MTKGPSSMEVSRDGHVLLTAPDMEIPTRLHGKTGPDAALPTRLQRVDFATPMPDDPLVKVDRMSMAHSLEVRCPDLDHRLVERVIVGPDRWKIRWRHRRTLLRAVTRRYLPHTAALRKKHGFQVPVDSLMRTTLRDLVAQGKVPCLEGWLYACRLSGMPGPRPAARSEEVGRDVAFCEG